MKHVWLVQRLNAPQGHLNPFCFGGGKINGGLSKEAVEIIKRIFSFEYMGAAEFEWGAVPTALETLLKSDLMTFNIDNKIWGICIKGQDKDIIAWIDNASKNHVSLKERLGLQEALYGKKYAKTKGWLKIEDDKKCEEPFMFFIDEFMFKATCEILGVNTKKLVMKSPKCNILLFVDKNVAGVFIQQLPEDQRPVFNSWLKGQTITSIEGQPFAYAYDYHKWYDSWIKDEVAIVRD